MQISTVRSPHWRRLRASGSQSGAQNWKKQVFDRVRTRITAFTETPGYRDMLKKSAEQAAAAVGGRGLTVYLREADMPLAETLCADLPKDTQFVCDATISLGGGKGTCRSDRAFGG